jgi:hypothetical protein
MAGPFLYGFKVIVVIDLTWSGYCNFLSDHTC